MYVCWLAFLANSFLRVKSLPKSRHTKRTVMAANNKCAMSGKQKIARPFAQLLISLTFALWAIGILLSVQFCFLNARAPRSHNYLLGFVIVCSFCVQSEAPENRRARPSYLFHISNRADRLITYLWPGVSNHGDKGCENSSVSLGKFASRALAPRAK